MSLRLHAETNNSCVDLCEYGLHSLANTKVDTLKDHGKNCIEIRPPLSHRPDIILYCQFLTVNSLIIQLLRILQLYLNTFICHY